MEEKGKSCVVCKTFYSTLGMQTGPVWGLWSKDFQICKYCVQAGKDARRERERYHAESLKQNEGEQER